VRERLVVVAPNWLGDAVLALPALARLRARYPGARLTVAARARVAGAFAMAPDVDDVVTLTWDGRWWKVAALAADARRLRELGATRAVLLPNSFGSALLVWRAGIPVRVGYARDGRSWLLTDAVPPPPPRPILHMSAFYLRLVDPAHDGTAAATPAELLRLPPEELAAMRRRLDAAGWDGRPLVVLAPGAAYGTAKQWVPAHVSTLITRLVLEYDAACALVGSRGDALVTAAIAAAVPRTVAGRVFDLAGRTGLRELAALLALARVCVSNDSGAMHVAAGVGTPVAALFGPTNEHATAPLVVAGGRVRVLTEDVDCRPCMLRTCPIDHRCMTRLAPERVLYTVMDLVRPEGVA
jgi:heptosyltransferase-2